MGAFIDLTGQRFGRLTVIERAENKNGKIMWKCKCECGKIVIIQNNNLKSGHTKSCGCYKKDHSQGKTHNKSNTRLYTIWENIKQRCYNSNCKNYIKYGKRGITICDEWKNSFTAFYDWAMSNGYADNLSINRKDNNGNYEPSNCEWTTEKNQANNRRSSRYITYNGKTQTLAQWADELNIDYRALWARINQCNWSIDKAFNTPIK